MQHCRLYQAILLHPQFEIHSSKPPEKGEVQLYIALTMYSVVALHRGWRYFCKMSSIRRPVTLHILPYDQWFSNKVRGFKLLYWSLYCANSLGSECFWIIEAHSFIYIQNYSNRHTLENIYSQLPYVDII